MSEIVLISDAHGDARLHGQPRFEEFARTMAMSATVAIQRKALAWCYLGDLCDPDSGAVVFRCQGLLADILVKLGAEGIDSFVIAGNHDVCNDGLGTTTLSPLRHLQSIVFPATKRKMIRIWEQPMAAMVDVEEGVDHLFVGLPHVEAKLARDAGELVRGLPAQLGPQMAARKPVVLAHLTPRGMVPGEEVTEMPRGRELMLPTEAIAEALPGAAVFCGHVHKRQTAEIDGVRVQVVGAAMAMHHGEEDGDPGFLVVKV